MYNQYNVEPNNFDTVISSFKNFLRAENISKGSIRSYLSDVRHFFGWFILFLKSNGQEKLEFASVLNLINDKVLTVYKNYQTSNNAPLKTINRRFSSLRRFGIFCKFQNWVSSNPFDTLKNIPPNQPFSEDKCHLVEFKIELWKKGASKLTIKNYLNDIKQFLSWERKS